MQFPLKNTAFLILRLTGNQILPLVSLPILYVRLGSNNFGLFLLAQAIFVYINVLVDYGFPITAVRDVAAARANPMGSPEARGAADLGQLFREVTATRLFICLCTCVVFALYTNLTSADPVFIVLVAISLAVALMIALQPLWYLQGCEKFGLIGITLFTSKLASLLSILLLVRQPSDLFLGHLLFLSSFLISGGVFLVATGNAEDNKAQVNFRQIGHGVRRRLIQGFPVFLGQAATTLFTSTNLLAVGAILGPTAAGHFGLADKAIRGLTALSTPLTEALFPRVSARIRMDLVAVSDYLRRLLRMLFLPMLIATLLIAACSGIIARLLTGGKPDSSVSIAIALMAPIPALVFTNNIFGTQILLGLDRSHIFMRNVLVSGALVPISSAMLQQIIGFYGAPVAALIGEIAIALLMYQASCSVIGRHWLRPAIRTQ